MARRARPDTLAPGARRAPPDTPARAGRLAPRDTPARLAVQRAQQELVVQAGAATMAHATFMPFGTGNTVTGSATFTNVSTGVQVVIHLANCPAGAHGIHIHEGAACTDANTQGAHWGGAGGPGEGIVESGTGTGSITCEADMTADLTYTRPSTPAATAWTIGAPAATNVIGHVMVVHAVGPVDQPDRLRTDRRQLTSPEMAS